tara:strand:- start:90 stop:419 length:330 start_codon:yes stop_codon:yes gene_type:complete
MQYLVIFKQAGEGCDYTIGCGMNYEIMEADSIEDLKEKITFPEGREEYSVFYQGFGYEEIIVVPFEQTEPLDIEELIKTGNASDEVLDEEEELSADEAEFERLKEKLGK